MSNHLKQHVRAVTLGSAAALFVSAAALAAPPANPILGLTGHTNTNAYDADNNRGVVGLSYGIDGGGAVFDANGDLASLANRSACGSANATCKILDGSGDGMLMYLVTDANGKKHINQIVGQNDGSGLFLGESFVEYNGGSQVQGNTASAPGTNIDSMASKYLIEDAAELASAGSGFRLSSEWLRGDYQQIQPSSYDAANTNGGTARDLDTVIDMNIGHVLTFHADGIVSENGGPNQAGMLVDIQSGTTADNTATDAEDAQAMGQFHVRLQGGSTPYTSTDPGIGSTDYRLGSPTVTLGTGTLAFGVNDGASATYIHQVGFGFNGSPDENYTVDHPDQRDFSYVRIWRTNGYPANIGTFQDPMNGIYASASGTDGSWIAATSELGAAPVYQAAPVVADNTVHAPDLNGAVVGTGANDLTAATSTGGSFTATGASDHDTDDLQAAWRAVFGVGP